MQQERFIQFPAAKEGYLSPGLLYEKVSTNFAIPRKEIYFGGPASSGSFRRLIDSGTAVDETRRQLVIGLNSQMAKSWAKQSADKFPDNKLTLAHLVGNSLEPKESNYNLYWQLHLSGVDPWFASQFVNFSQRPEMMAAIDDHNGGLQREDAYNSLSDLFFSMIQETPEVTLNPISAVVFLPDHRTSLGCRLERRTVIRLNEMGFNIPMYEAVMNLASPKASYKENELLIEAYGYIQQNGQPRLNGVSFTPPFVREDVEDFIILKPLAVKAPESNNHSIGSNNSLLRIHELRNSGDHSDVSPVVGLSKDCKISASAGVVSIDQLSFDPEKLVAAMLGLKISNGRATLDYPKIESGGMKVIPLRISVDVIDKLWNACAEAMNISVNILKNL